MAVPTLRSALNYYLKLPHLTQADRAHLERWLDEARNRLWEQLAADIRRRGALQPFVEGYYGHFIWWALLARRSAERETISPVLRRKRKQHRVQQERSGLVALAELLEDVVRRYQSCRKAHHLERVPSPSGPLPDLPEVAQAKQALEWLKREPRRLCLIAERVSADESDRDWNRVRPSRQSGGKGKRSRSRELGVFMRLMVNDMCECFGRPRYHAVAMMTNIAFPDANVVAESVRSACRPTTRTGRRRSGALSSMS
jgi:hypothetical protein